MAAKKSTVRAPRITTSHKGATEKKILRAKPAKKASLPKAKSTADKPRVSMSPEARLASRIPPKPRKKHEESESGASDNARALATLVAIAALDKKAIGLELLDVAGKVDYADFLVLMTGRSDRHVQSLAQGIEEELRKQGKRPLSVEGVPSARWVLMDLGDVVVHVFQEEARGLYDIDGLWMDAKRLPLPRDEAPL